MEELSSPLTAHVTGWSHQSWNHLFFVVEIPLPWLFIHWHLSVVAPTVGYTEGSLEPFYIRNPFPLIYLLFPLCRKMLPVWNSLRTETTPLASLNYQCLTQCLTHSKFPINVCSISVWVSEDLVTGIWKDYNKGWYVSCLLYCFWSHTDVGANFSAIILLAVNLTIYLNFLSLNSLTYKKNPLMRMLWRLNKTNWMIHLVSKQSNQ